MSLVKIIVGAGDISDEGWVSLNRDVIDVTSGKSFIDYFKCMDFVDIFFAEHVWEHLNPEDIIPSSRNCRLFLKPGGRLRIAVPDGLHPDPEYIEWVRPGGVGPGASDHKILFDHIMLRAMLTMAGFSRVIPVEWWDDNGTFRSNPWRTEDGFVRRSYKYDQRNLDRKIPYTSLIVDAIK